MLCCAVAAAEKVSIIQLDVGADASALQEAWNKVKASHADLPAMFFSIDAGQPRLLHCSTTLYSVQCTLRVALGAKTMDCPSVTMSSIA